MHNSTERINKIYKITSEAGNNYTNKQDEYLQNFGKKRF